MDPTASSDSQMVCLHTNPPPRKGSQTLKTLDLSAFLLWFPPLGTSVPSSLPWKMSAYTLRSSPSMGQPLRSKLWPGMGNMMVQIKDKITTIWFSRFSCHRPFQVWASERLSHLPWTHSQKMPELRLGPQQCWAASTLFSLWHPVERDEHSNSSINICGGSNIPI